MKFILRKNYQGLKLNNKKHTSLSDVPHKQQHLHSIHCHLYFFTCAVKFSLNCKQEGWPRIILNSIELTWKKSLKTTVISKKEIIFQHLKSYKVLRCMCLWKYFRGTFWTQSNIKNGTFCNRTVNYFRKKLHLRCLTRFWIGLCTLLLLQSLDFHKNN